MQEISNKIKDIGNRKKQRNIKKRQLVTDVKKFEGSGERLRKKEKEKM